MSKLKFARYCLTKRRALPIYLIFGVTNVCNARCMSCFAWRQTDSPREDLSLEEIERTVASMRHHILTLVLTGGEVFLRKDLVDIIRLFNKYTEMEFLTIPTNGICYDDIFEAIKEILDVFPNNLVINLSLDGLGEMHDRLRGVPGNFRRVEQLYGLLEPLKRGNPRLSVGVNTVLNSINQEHYREIFEYVRRNWKSIDQHNFEVMRGDYRDRSIDPPDAAFLWKETSNIQRLTSQYSYHKTGVYQKFLQAAKVHYHNVVLDHIAERRALPCFAGSLAGVINYRGMVYPCELYKEIGDIREYDYDFRRLWFSKEADKIRNEINKTKCTCTHSCFQFVNILFNPWEYTRLLRPIRPSVSLRENRQHPRSIHDGQSSGTQE